MRSQGYFGRRTGQVVLCCSILALLLSLPTSASAFPAPAGSGGEGATASIVGGRAATIEEFPSLAYVQAREGKGGFVCTGTVVSPRVILTAAHCVENIQRGTFTPPSRYAVATGTTSPSKALGENVFRVVENHVFPGFDPGRLRGDAAILVLDRPTTAPPIALADPADAALYAGGDPIQLAGWGLTGPNAAKGPKSLRATTMVVQPPSFCERKTRRYYSPFSSSVQFCALDAPTKKSGGCFGDSGGPAIGQRPDGTPVELGIVSTGGPFCNPQYPNVLTRADTVSTWVAEWVAATEAGAPRPVADAALPQMTRSVAETFAVFTLQNQFGRTFERAREVFGRCGRSSRGRYKCKVAFLSGRNLYAGTISPAYIRRQNAVAWQSHFRVEWAALKCLNENPRRCKIHTRRG